MTYAITGSTGPFGTAAIRRLLDWKIPASSIVAIARDREKAAALSSLGVEVRFADYERPAELESALRDVDRLLLVSGSELGKRIGQHRNVISAAKKAGVTLVAYTSIAQADRSKNPLAPEHAATETFLRESGVPFIILRNNWYTDNYADVLAQARSSGTIEAAAGEGKVCSATRAEFAEAAARALIGDGPTGTTYELGGEAWGFADLAKAAGELLGREVAYVSVGAEERTESLKRAGLPAEVAAFVASLDVAIAEGTLAGRSSDLETLLGRKPKSLKEGLRESLA